MAYRSSTRQRKYDYLIRQGFYPYEAQEFSRVSRKGMSAPYFQRMIRSRRRTVDNLKDSGRTPNEIRKYIKEQYIKNGWLKQDSIGRVKIDPWKLLRDHEDKAFRRGEEYESPWRKRKYKQSSRKKERKRVTRRDMVKSIIAKLERRIENTKQPDKRADLQGQLNYYKLMLERM